MRFLLWIGIAFIVLGVLGFTRGSFTYTKDTDKAKLGPIEIQVKDKERVRVPPLVSGAAVAGGVALVLYGSRWR